MMQNRPVNEPASPPENVVFLDSSNFQSDQPPPDNTNTPSTPKSDPFTIDGGTTIKSGGVPASAWQSNAAELAKLLVGKQLGIYLIEQALGTGGMAAVFRAVDPHLNRTVALKVLPPLLAAQQEQVQRFEREARVAAQLEHDNIAKVHFSGQDQGLHFIAYEFIEGINLREMLEQKGGRLEVSEALNYMTQAARGLAHSASRGITHRDIKPSNLVITPEGKVKLVDLGLARNSFKDDTDGLTQSGATLGTFDYLSPEQAIDPRNADICSDIYSLGCTFYHALTGVPPVPEGTAARKLHSHQMELPRDPRELNPAIPEKLVDILSKMMAKRPEDRYQNANDLVSELEELSNPINKIASSRQAINSASEQPGLSWTASILGLLFIIGCIVAIDSMKAPPIKSVPDLSIQDRYLDAGPIRSPVESNETVDTKEATDIRLSLEVETTNELVEALKRPEGGTIYLKRSRYDISSASRLVIRGGEWTIRPVEGKVASLHLMEGVAGSMLNLKLRTL